VPNFKSVALFVLAICLRECDSFYSFPVSRKLETRDRRTDGRTGCNTLCVKMMKNRCIINKGGIITYTSSYMYMLCRSLTGVVRNANAAATPPPPPPPEIIGAAASRICHGAPAQQPVLTSASRISDGAGGAAGGLVLVEIHAVRNLFLVGFR